MALLATPVAPPHWGTTLGGFGAAAVAIGSRGLRGGLVLVWRRRIGRATPAPHARSTTNLVGASTASSVLSPPSTFSSLAAYAVARCQVRWGRDPSIQPALADLTDPSLDQPQLILQFLRVQLLRNSGNHCPAQSSLVQQ